MNKSPISDMQEAEKKASEIIADAESKKLETINRARKKAEEIIAEARSRADIEREKSLKEAYAADAKIFERGIAAAKKESEKIRKKEISRAGVEKIAKRLAEKIVG